MDKIDGYVYVQAAGQPATGLSGVVVSNQLQTTLTDENGYFSLPWPEDGAYVFVCKPAGYAFLQNEWCQPQFYTRHLVNPIPNDPNGYPVDQPTPLTGEPLSFTLVPTPVASEKEPFTVVFSGDLQPTDEERVQLCAQLAAPAIMQEAPLFWVPMGDLAWDLLAVHQPMRQLFAAMRLPYFSVLGNHDINLHYTDSKYKSETYKHYFGPTYFSFNEGTVHFVVLDDIGYEGWKKEERGATRGWLGKHQLEWLRNDLAKVPADHLVVLLTHIPIYCGMRPHDEYRNIVNREALFSVLAERSQVLALSAHTHTIEHVDMREGGWKYPGRFDALIVGAPCGIWWEGPRDAFGHPAMLAVDGSENGYFVFEFRGNSWSYRFQPLKALPGKRGRVFYHRVAGKPAMLWANIYTATPQATISWRMHDQATWLPMQRKITEDPTVADFIVNNKEHLRPWISAKPCSHLWQAAQAQPWEPGFYTLHLRVVDVYDSFEMTVLVEV